jgi:hypothetical protein
MIDFSKKITIKRTKVGEYKGGFYEKGSAKEFSVMASIQPHFFKEVDKLPEGRQSTDAVKIYTESKLISKNNNYESDLIKYNGLWYEVYQVKDYSGLGFLPHFKGISLLVNEENQEGLDE